MPRTRKPRRGSLAYWHRRRAKRIYPRVSYWHASKEAKPLGFAAWKVGMTHVQYTDPRTTTVTHGKTITRSATILDAAPLFVCGIRYYNNNLPAGEKWVEKLPEGAALKRGIKKVTHKKAAPAHFTDIRLVVTTQPDKSGMAKKKSEIFEIGIGGDLDKKKAYAESVLGKEIHSEEIFKPGDIAEVSGVTKGHGFTGPVKRFGIRIQGRKDDQHHRHVGAIGTEGLRHVDWRVPAAGQHGFHNRTEDGKRVLMVDNDPKKITPRGGFLGYGNIKSFILVEGSLPGSRKRLLVLRKSQQPAKPVDLSYVSLESKQGR